MSLLPIIVLLFLVMWLLVVRPQRKRQREQQQLLESAAPGDEILTAGGVYGTVRSIVDDEDVMVEIAPGTEVRVARRAIASVLTQDESEVAELERLQREAEEQAQGVAATDGSER